MKPIDWLRPARCFLVERILRLRAALENLAFRLRDGIAVAIGDAVAGVLRALLDETERKPVRRDDHGFDPWHDREDRYWQDDLDEFDREDEPLSSPEAATPQANQRSRWAQALAIAAQGSTWLLAHGTGRFRLPVTFAVVAVAGIAIISGAPVVAILVALAGSAMNLMSLVDHVASQAGDLANAVKP